jgi:hypothetical protein
MHCKKGFALAEVTGTWQLVEVTVPGSWLK